MSRWNEPATKGDWYFACALSLIGTVIAFVVMW